jgi:hypothetical protein
MMSNMMKGNPKVSRKEALFWCCNAKNALQMIEGFSSYQLAFERNPCLPTLADDLPPAIVKKPKSQSLAEMLAGQEASRKAFREVQADKAIRKALSWNIRVQGRRMKMEESVCFGRLGDARWRGPGRVVTIDAYIATVKISNQKYNCRHEDCLPGGTEFTKFFFYISINPTYSNHK